MRRPDRPLRVLIVDDDEDDHILTEEILREARRAQFVVEHARNAMEARRRMRENGFDVCLLDYDLGSTTGVELFREASSDCYAVPTILLSGHDDEDVADLVIEAGLADYLEKRSLERASLERAILYALERDAARREIVALNRSLEERVRERTNELESFCYSVSHDLRAPLRAINATSAILKEDFADALPPEALKELDRQAEASTRLGNLIDDLLQFVRLGRAQAHHAPFDLTALAGTVAEELRLDVDVQEGMEAEGDASLVRLLLQNLLDNAAKFSNPGAPRIEVGGDGETFYVRDHGIGFDPKYAHKLFQPFERLHRDEFPGTGIGLANVKRIVERHGGRVWAESAPGKGATFWFTLRH